MLKTIGNFQKLFAKRNFSKFTKFDFEDPLNLKSLLKEEEVMVTFISYRL
jgi:hypothetical protein